MQDFNILVTYDLNQSGFAEKEVKRNLEEVGVPIEKVHKTSVEGIFGLRIEGDPKRVVADLKVLCEEDPDLFIHTYHWVPIERWVQATDEDMERAAAELGEGIQEDEGWMMHLHKRHHGGHSHDLIKKLTDPINRGSVNLKNPDKILAVEILGDRAGLSLLRKKELLDTNRLRQEIASREM